MLRGFLRAREAIGIERRVQIGARGHRLAPRGHRQLRIGPQRLRECVVRRIAVVRIKQRQAPIESGLRLRVRGRDGMVYERAGREGGEQKRSDHAAFFLRPRSDFCKARIVREESVSVARLRSRASTKSSSGKRPCVWRTLLCKSKRPSSMYACTTSGCT